MHGNYRSLVAAARAHPAGFAATSAVIVTAIVLFTFVTSGVIPAIPPGLLGAGPAPVIQPGTGQPRHRTLPQQAVPTGPPVRPGLPISLAPSAPSLTGHAQAAPPATGPGPVIGVSPVGPVLATSARRSPRTRLDSC